MAIITKLELFTRVAAETKLSKSDIEKCVTSLLEIITDSLKKGESIRLSGFGTFSVRSVAARMGRNPRTGDPLQVNAYKQPVLKASSTLKDQVNHV